MIFSSVKDVNHVVKQRVVFKKKETITFRVEKVDSITSFLPHQLIK